MLKIVRYVNEVGGHAKVPAVEAPDNEYKSLKDAFEIALGHEKGVTESINGMVDQAFSLKDFATYNFLQWFVAEQVEEEAQFSTIIDRMKRLA